MVVTTHLPWYIAYLGAIDLVIQLLCACEQWTLCWVSLKVREVLICGPDIHQFQYLLATHLFLAKQEVG